MRRILIAKLQNRTGVLNRFTGVLSRRQVNIESISIGRTQNPEISKVTVIIEVETLGEAECIIKQLDKQIDVINIQDVTDTPHLERETILIKVSAPAEKRAELLSVIQPFGARVVNMSLDAITVQMTASIQKIESLIRLLETYGIEDVTRTGAMAFVRD